MEEGLSIKAVVGGFVLLVLLLSTGCFYLQLPSLANGSLERRAITVEAEGELLNYSEELFWDEEQFTWEYEEFSADRAGYLKDFIASFTADHMEPYGLEATGWTVFFISGYELEGGKVSYSARFQCKVQGAWSGSWFGFEWLLRPSSGERSLWDSVTGLKGAIEALNTCFLKHEMIPANRGVSGFAYEGGGSNTMGWQINDTRRLGRIDH